MFLCNRRRGTTMLEIGGKEKDTTDEEGPLREPKEEGG